MGFNTTNIFTTIFTSGLDDYGGVIKGYKVNTQGHMVERQPIDAKGYKYTWGEDITSKWQLIDDICPLFLKPKEIIIINSTSYEIEKVIEWDTYSIYAVVEKEVNLI